MLSLAPTIAPTRAFQRLIVLAVAGLLCALLLPTLPPVLVTRQTSAPTRDLAAPITPAPALPTTQQLPPGLGPVLNATLAADDAQEYAVTPLASPADGLRAENPAQRFATTFGTGGVAVAPAGGAAFTLHATTILTANRVIAIPATEPITAGPRVEYRGDGLTEWYVNGPRGLEQGFTLAAAPAGAETFTVSLTVAGAVPTQTEDGTLLLGDLRYRDLAVIDAAGATLPAHFVVADGTIQIVVDARGAVWPVTIDPLLTTATLTADDGVNGNEFGTSVAAATANGMTTVVIGAPYNQDSSSHYQGEVYVFTGSGGAYTQQARLQPLVNNPTGTAFGFCVAVTISGGTTTIVVGASSSNEVYVFTGSGSTYTQQAILANPGPVAYFPSSVAATTNSGITTIAVGATGTISPTSSSGSVFLFAGSGASYPLQATLLDAGGVAGEKYGYSVAIAQSGGVNTVIIGVPLKIIGPNTFPQNSQGAIFVATGRGSNYSISRIIATDGHRVDGFGTSVALAISGGTNIIAVGAPGKNRDQSSGFGFGGAYVFVGSGSSYAQTVLIDSLPISQYNRYFGTSVAVDISYSQTLVAVGAPQSSYVALFAQHGSSYIESLLPETTGWSGDEYGTSVAMVIAPNNDPTVVSGAIHGPSRANYQGTATVSSWSAQASVQLAFGDGAQTLSSTMGTYTAAPFHLAARVVDGNGVAIPPIGVTFTVNPVGGAGGLFNPNDATSTTLHVTTRDGTNGTIVGQTDTLNLSPSDTAGTFTVSAVADGTALNATYTLKIIASVPVPTINPVTPLRPSGAVTRGATPNAVTTQPAGLSPPIVYLNEQVAQEVHITGTGYISKARGTQVFYQHGTDPPVSPDFGYYGNDKDLSFFMNVADVRLGNADTSVQIYLVNPPGTPGGTDGGKSNSVTLRIVQHRPAPTGSHLVCSGATQIIALQSSLVVPTLCKVVDAQGRTVPSTTTGTATGLVGSASGELIGQDGSTLISHDGGSLISHDGGSLISHDGGSVISNDGGSLVSQGGGNSLPKVGSGLSPSPVSVAGTAPSSRALTPDMSVKQVASTRVGQQVANTGIGDYVASTDANGIIMAPPVTSNGVPGTYTRTLAVDGIAPITYTVANLNPHDGNPTTITSLSRTTAYTGEPAFPLTITGTGFTAGSVISYGGVQLVTTYLSPTQVRATVPADLLNYVGALSVLVINPDPNGGASLPATFSVTQYVNPLPPPQPTAPPVSGPAPLPVSRPTSPPAGGPPPPPLPPHR